MAQAAPPSSACPALLAHQFPRLQDEAPQNLCQYAGKVVANFPGEVAPDSPALVGAIEKSLNQK